MLINLLLYAHTYVNAYTHTCCDANLAWKAHLSSKACEKPIFLDNAITCMKLMVHIFT